MSFKCTHVPAKRPAIVERPENRVARRTLNFLDRAEHTGLVPDFSTNRQPDISQSSTTSPDRPDARQFDRRNSLSPQASESLITVVTTPCGARQRNSVIDSVLWPKESLSFVKARFSGNTKEGAASRDALYLDQPC